MWYKMNNSIWLNHQSLFFIVIESKFHSVLFQEVKRGGIWMFKSFKNHLMGFSGLFPKINQNQGDHLCQGKLPKL